MLIAFDFNYKQFKGAGIAKKVEFAHNVLIAFTFGLPSGQDQLPGPRHS